MNPGRSVTANARSSPPLPFPRPTLSLEKGRRKNKIALRREDRLSVVNGGDYSTNRTSSGLVPDVGPVTKYQNNVTNKYRRTVCEEVGKPPRSVPCTTVSDGFADAPGLTNGSRINPSRFPNRTDLPFTPSGVGGGGGLSLGFLATEFRDI